MRRESFARKIEGFESSDPVFKKAIISVMVLAAAVGLVLIGTVFGITPVFKYFAAWHESKSYLPVEAKVLEVQFFSEHETYISRSTKRPTIRGGVNKINRTTATFEYVYQDKKYFSHRTTLLNEDYQGRDNYPKELFDQLNAKFTAGETVTLWLDPQHPEQALYDRSILWLAIIILFPIAFACPIAAIWLIVYVASLWRAPRSANTEFVGSTRWIAIPAESHKLARSIFLFLLYISLVWPIAPYAWIHFNSVSEVIVRLGVTVWCVVGLAFLSQIAKAWKAKRRFDGLHLLIAPQDKLDTKSLQGLIKLSPTHVPKSGSLSAALEVRGRMEYMAWYTGQRNAKKTIPLWKSKELDLLASRGVQSLEFDFDFPGKVLLSPYDEELYFNYYWKIRVEIDGSFAEFKLPELTSIPTIIPSRPQFHKRPVAA